MKQPRSFIILVGAVVAAAALVNLRPSRADQEAASAAPPSVEVVTQKPVTGYLTNSVTAYGSAVPSAGGNLTVNVQSDGRIDHLFVTAGEAVKAGQRLLEFEISAAARSTLEQAKSALDLARSEQARIARLLAQQLATRDQLLTAEKGVSDAKAALDALNEDHPGESRWVIPAPFDGVVSSVPVAQGDRVASGAALLILTRGDGLIIRVGIEPSKRPRLAVGQKVALKSIGGSGGEQQGTLVRIDHVINPATRLVDADVAVAAPVIQGEAYMAQIAIERVAGWLVPRSAVLLDSAGMYVFQTAHDQATRVPVRLLGIQGSSAVLSGSIDPRLPIVISGNYQLSDGMAVRTKGTVQ